VSRRRGGVSGQGTFDRTVAEQQTNRRIEKAKLMLAERKHSVIEVALTVGFSETSSFGAVFRKITGQTPNRYHRALE
jgi:AraC-like DNA-binding protein